MQNKGLNQVPSEHTVDPKWIAYIASQAADYPHLYIKRILTAREGVTGKHFSTQYINKLSFQIQEALDKCYPLYEKYKESKEDPDLGLQYLDKVIEVHSKDKVGNCGVLAVFALYYVLDNAPKVRAEIFHIDDNTNKKSYTHSFVVIGRKNESDPTNPKKWGDTAYICDPWSEKFYPAAQYLENLRSFNYDDRSKTFSTEKFTHDKHTLIRDRFQNTDTLRPAIKVKFQNQFKEFAVKIEKLNEKLKEIDRKLDPKENKKKEVLNRKMNDASSLLEKVNKALILINEDNLGYSALKELYKNFRREFNILQFSEADKKAFSLFGLFKSATYNEVDNVFKELQQSLDREQSNTPK